MKCEGSYRELGNELFYNAILSGEFTMYVRITPVVIVECFCTYFGFVRTVFVWFVALRNAFALWTMSELLVDLVYF